MLPFFFRQLSHSSIHTNAQVCAGNLHELTQRYTHSYIAMLGTHTYTDTHTELIKVRYGAAFEGSREPVVDEPLNNSLGQAWNSILFSLCLSYCLLCSCSNIPHPAVFLSVFFFFPFFLSTFLILLCFVSSFSLLPSLRLFPFSALCDSPFVPAGKLESLLT